jgi:hypothetical protein
MTTIARSFIKFGKRYFVPNDSFWANTDWSTFQSNNGPFFSLRDDILARWEPPVHFKTMAPKAHIAALLPHLHNQWFAVIDLRDFYDHVTRTKVHRSLEKIGFKRSAAYRIAGESTVSNGSGYSLPRGFRQSPILSTLALDQSLFGSRLRRANLESIVTVYADDILLSAEQKDALERDFLELLNLLDRSNFPTHPSKTQFPSQEVTAFNIRLSQSDLRFTDERMWKFLSRARALLPNDAEPRTKLYDRFFGDYIRSINVRQADQLRVSLGIRQID